LGWSQHPRLGPGRTKNAQIPSKPVWTKSPDGVLWDLALKGRRGWLAASRSPTLFCAVNLRLSSNVQDSLCGRLQLSGIELIFIPGTYLVTRSSVNVQRFASLLDGGMMDGHWREQQRTLWVYKGRRVKPASRIAPAFQNQWAATENKGSVFNRL
jgi:hypothetical protein